MNVELQPLVEQVGVSVVEEKGGVRLFHLFDDDLGEEADAIG